LTDIRSPIFAVDYRLVVDRLNYSTDDPPQSGNPRRDGHPPCRISAERSRGYGRFVASDELEVVFVDGDTGVRVGMTRLPRDRVPQSFDRDTTVNIGATTWMVDRADPSTAGDVALADKLVLTVRRVGQVPAADILYSLPTICDALPGTVGSGAGIDCLRISEDDWRQIELVSVGLRDVVDAELHAIHAIYAEHGRRNSSGGLVGFAKIHIRTRPDRPLLGPLPRRQLLHMLPAADHHYDGVGFTGSPGVVVGSFAARYGPIQLRLAMAAFGVVLVDWCRCLVADPTGIS
jgi:hypothetical protein